MHMQAWMDEEPPGEVLHCIQKTCGHVKMARF